jgi:hypothetical protein
MIRRCLEKAPDERFQSASDLAFAIAALSASSSGVEAQAAASDSPLRRWLRPLAAAGIILASVAVGAFLMTVRQGTPRGLGTVLFRQLSFEPEAIFNARFAPDGETVLYSSATDGNIPDLLIHRPDYPAPQSMGLHDVRLLSISTKGQVAILTHATYLAQRQFKGTLSEIALGRGAPARSCKMYARLTGLLTERNWRLSARWTDGTAWSFPSGKCCSRLPGI